MTIKFLGVSIEITKSSSRQVEPLVRQQDLFPPGVHPVNLSMLLGRTTEKVGDRLKQQVITRHNIQEPVDYFGSLEVCRHFDITIDHERTEAGKTFYYDDTHEGEWGVVCTVPATITFTVTASPSVRTSTEVEPRP